MKKTILFFALWIGVTTMNSALAQTWNTTELGIAGAGTSGDPWQITTAEQLAALSDYVSAGNGNSTSGKYYKLMNNIDLSGYSSILGWKPIGDWSSGTATTEFQGYFNGNFFAVQNLTINRPTQNSVGLFGCISSATIVNLGVENCNIVGGGKAGGLVCSVHNGTTNSTIANCYVTGNVSGNKYIGGLMSETYKCNITNCYTNCNVKGKGEGTSSYTGGLIGYNIGASISYCYAIGDVSAEGRAGGLIGYHYVGTVKNCVAANSSVTSTFPSINRIASSMYSSETILQNNYANNAMVVKDNTSTTVSITDNLDGIAGYGISLSDLKSKVFYATGSNWVSGAWDFTNVWDICEGEDFPKFKWQTLNCGEAPFVAVTNITGVPTAATATLPLTLSGILTPGYATNRNIAWSVEDAGTTGATIAAGTKVLNTTAAGTVTVRATIINGTAAGIDYTKDFTITVTEAIAGTIVTITTAVNNAAYGSVLGGGVYERDASVNLTALPKTNAYFTNWTDGNTDNPRTITASDNLTFTANFAACDMSELLSQIAQLKSDTAALNTQIAGLQTDTMNLNNQITNLQTDTAYLNTQIVVLQTDTILLNNQIAGLNNKITGLMTDTASCNQNTVVLLEQITKLQADTMQLRNYVTTLAYNLLTCTSSLSSCENDNTTLQNQVAKLKTDTMYLHNQVINLTSDLTTCNTSLENCNNGNTDDLQAQILELQNDLATCGSSLVTCNNNNTTLQGQVNTLTNDLATCSSSLTTCNNNNTTLQSNLSACDAETIRLQGLLNDCDNVGVSEAPAATPLKVYPNPTNGQLTINNEQLIIGDVQIFDVMGRMQRIESKTAGDVITLDISHLPAGVYMLKAVGQTVKVVKN